MSTSPLQFVENFLKQPFPTMGMAPSTTITKTGGTVIQEGDGKDGLGKTASSMWARVASNVPFGWTLDGFRGLAKAASGASEAVVQKINDGPSAVEGFVKTVSDTISSTVNWTKWIVVGIVGVVIIVLVAQVKTLVPGK